MHAHMTAEEQRVLLKRDPSRLSIRAGAALPIQPANKGRGMHAHMTADEQRSSGSYSNAIQATWQQGKERRCEHSLRFRGTCREGQWTLVERDLAALLLPRLAGCYDHVPARSAALPLILSRGVHARLAPAPSHEASASLA